MPALTPDSPDLRRANRDLAVRCVLVPRRSSRRARAGVVALPMKEYPSARASILAADGALPASSGVTLDHFRKARLRAEAGCESRFDVGTRYFCVGGLGALMVR